MTMAIANIIHYKKDCISCGACAAILPEFWLMDDEGLAHLKNSTPVNSHFEREIATADELNRNQEAADCCPVNIIKVEKKSA